MDIKELPFRFFDSDSEIVIGDVTEKERPEADKTKYVGGRAIPFWSVLFSSKTLSDDLTSSGSFRKFV